MAKPVEIALADTFPGWRFLEVRGGDWVATRAPADAPLEVVLTGVYETYRGEALWVVVNAVRHSLEGLPVRRPLRLTTPTHGPRHHGHSSAGARS